VELGFHVSGTDFGSANAGNGKTDLLAWHKQNRLVCKYIKSPCAQVQKTRRNSKLSVLHNSYSATMALQKSSPKKADDSVGFERGIKVPASDFSPLFLN
jgi:hypothetical protein